MTIFVMGNGYVCKTSLYIYNTLKPHSSYMKTRNLISFEFQQNKCTFLPSELAFPLLRVLVQGLTIVHKDSSTKLALQIHSMALFFEK